MTYRSGNWCIKALIQDRSLPPGADDTALSYRIAQQKIHTHKQNGNNAQSADTSFGCCNQGGCRRCCIFTKWFRGEYTVKWQRQCSRLYLHMCLTAHACTDGPGNINRDASLHYPRSYSYFWFHQDVWPGVSHTKCALQTSPAIYLQHFRSYGRNI